MQEKQLDKTTLAFMLSVALLFDLIQALLTIFLITSLITPIISAGAWVTFFIWFKMHGISLGTAKRSLTMGGSLIAEVIPFLNFLPAWTLMVFLIYLTTKLENAPVIGKVVQPQAAAVPARSVGRLAKR